MAEVRPGVFPSPIAQPYADDTTQPFWDAALEGRLLGSRCNHCGTILIPPAPRCFNCQHVSFDWVELPGTGTVYAFTVVRHALGGYLQPVVPYVSGVVELDGTQGAGARMVANIVDCDPDTIAVGTPVRVVFDKVSDTLAVPRFAPR